MTGTFDTNCLFGGDCWKLSLLIFQQCDARVKIGRSALMLSAILADSTPARASSTLSAFRRQTSLIIVEITVNL